MFQTLNYILSNCIRCSSNGEFYKSRRIFQSKSVAWDFLKACGCSRVRIRMAWDFLNHNKSLDLPYVPMFKCGEIIF